MVTFFSDVAQQPGDAFMGKLIIALTVLIGAIGTVLSVWLLSRRQPPLPEELHRDFVTREAFSEMQKETAETVRRVHGRIDDLTRELHRSNADAERSRGNLHGKMETVEERLMEIQKSAESWHARILEILGHRRH